jgi:hypothetical protein
MKICLGLLVVMMVFMSVGGCSGPERTTTPTMTTTPTFPDTATVVYDLELANKFCPVVHLKNEPEVTENFEPDPVQLMVDLSLR